MRQTPCYSAAFFKKCFQEWCVFSRNMIGTETIKQDDDYGGDDVNASDTDATIRINANTDKMLKISQKSSGSST